MRTKNEEVKDPMSGDEPDYPAEILDSAEREELEQLRAERDARNLSEKTLIDAAKRAAESITLNLPPAAGKGIVMAGKMFHHGQTYQVDNNTKWALEEAERRCWAHEASLHESENKGRKKTYRAV